MHIIVQIIHIVRTILVVNSRNIASNFNVNADMVSVCTYTLTHEILRSYLWQDIYD